MRVLGTIAGLVAGLGAVTAFAADMPGGSAGYDGYGGYGGYDAGQIVIWDAEPGVVVRKYWLPPWGNRHYFPSNGEMPEIGRDEDLSKGTATQPAKTYRRSWSASSSSAAPGVSADPPMNFAPDILVQPSMRWR
jgi:hypothetical protein